MRKLQHFSIIFIYGSYNCIYADIVFGFLVFVVSSKTYITLYSHCSSVKEICIFTSRTIDSNAYFPRISRRCNNLLSFHIQQQMCIFLFDTHLLSHIPFPCCFCSLRFPMLSGSFMRIFYCSNGSDTLNVIE